MDIQQNILQKERIQESINKNIAAINPQKVSQIDRKIQQIITPTNITFTKNYVDENITVQQIRSYSIMNFLSEIFIQMISQLMVSSKQIDLKTGKQKQINGKPISIFVQQILNARQQSLSSKIAIILMALKQKTVYRYYIEMIVRTIIEHAQKFLVRCNYNISPQLAIKVLLNPHCLKSQQTDSKTLQYTQNRNITKVLFESSQQNTAPNVQDISQKLTLKLMNKLFPNKIQKPQGKWAQIKRIDLVDPSIAIAQRYHQQQNYLQGFLKMKQMTIQNMILKSQDMNISQSRRKIQQVKSK